MDSRTVFEVGSPRQWWLLQVAEQMVSEGTLEARSVLYPPRPAKFWMECKWFFIINSKPLKHRLCFFR